MMKQDRKNLSTSEKKTKSSINYVPCSFEANKQSACVGRLPLARIQKLHIPVVTRVPKNSNPKKIAKTSLKI